MATRKTATHSSKKPAKKAVPKKAAKSKSFRKSKSENYTKPELREKIKKRVAAGSKGGRAGQWSARKAQIVAHDYETEGGSYKRPRNPAQKSLKKWGDERWRTADGKQAIQGKLTHRYLPDSAWKKLSPSERKATDRKKVAGSKRGKQFVANTSSAGKARKHATRRKHS
jgi:hypothetical protein